LPFQATVHNRSVALPVAEVPIIEPGLTLEELAERTGVPAVYLRAALSSELTAGRVVRSPDGRYRLNACVFEPGVLDALRSFSPPSTAELAGRRNEPAGDGRLSRAERELLDRLELMPQFGTGLAVRHAAG
jgi:DNA-binding IclR family transcriptional regulator